MMDLIIETVKKLEQLIKDGGCDDCGVVLDVRTGTVNCQFEHGVCMTASFGGRSADFVSFNPIRANTKISFMFGAALDNLQTRGAAAAIMNAATGFFCLSRILHACPESSHNECRGQILHELEGKRIFCIGSMPAIETTFRSTIVTNQQDADVILLNGEGIIEQETGSIIQNYKDSKRFLCLGPSTAGIARLNQLEHWCPFGICQQTKTEKSDLVTQWKADPTQKR